MKSHLGGVATVLAALITGLAASPAAAQTPKVTELRLPASGLQPHTAVDQNGMVHLVYLAGAADAANAWYAIKKPGEAAFGTPIRVNSQPGSAIAIGTIRGPQIAVGRSGRVHIAWNGSSKAKPSGPADGQGRAGAPMLYARMNDAGTGFEQQRCVAVSSTALDGGGSIAADDEGRVFVGWHGAMPAGPGPESERRFWVARSVDDGATFASEQPVTPDGLGACACCGTVGLADTGGRIHFLYRSAAGNESRNMQWLSSIDHGATFTAQQLQPWKLNQCPMTSAWIAEAGKPAGKSLALAWETEGQVYFARVDPKTGERAAAVAPTGDERGRKHPVVAVDPQGRVLLAWTEGTAWAKGGRVAWEIFAWDDKPIAGSRRGGDGDLAVWNSVAAAAADDGFLVVY